MRKGIPAKLSVHAPEQHPRISPRGWGQLLLSRKLKIVERAGLAVSALVFSFLAVRGRVQFLEQAFSGWYNPRMVGGARKFEAEHHGETLSSIRQLNVLREERTEVIQALLELDCIPSGMELFPAGDDEQWTGTWMLCRGGGSDHFHWVGVLCPQEFLNRTA